VKLHFSPTSPYVRKVRAVAAEKGLAGNIELLSSSPWVENDLPAANPSGRVPTLVTDDGTALFDSRVICEYLDDTGGGETLFPKGGNRWQVLRTAAIAEGILDAGVSIANERRKDKAHWSDWFIGRQKDKINRSLDLLEKEAGSLGGPVTIAQIGVGVALGYIEFRKHVDDWRAGHPKLTAWYADFARRPSMTSPEPKE
jgi:glutathione S-transferase